MRPIVVYVEKEDGFNPASAEVEAFEEEAQIETTPVRSGQEVITKTPPRPSTLPPRPQTELPAITKPAASFVQAEAVARESGSLATFQGRSRLDKLRENARDLGAPSTLLHYVDDPNSGIEITKAHPGSLPQFIIGRSTLLSHLYRDEVGARNATIAANNVLNKHIELRSTRGIDAVFIAVGLASWQNSDESYLAPILLRPLEIRRNRQNYELKLQGSFQLNPELIRVISEQFGITLDASYLVSLAYEDGVFKPQRVIDALRNQLREIPSFRAQSRIVASVFADVGERMFNDLRSVNSSFVDALLGDESSQKQIKSASSQPPVGGADNRMPAADSLLVVSDQEQEEVLARVVAGENLLVNALPGTGSTQTILNMLGELVKDQKRVLLVSAKESTAVSIRHRLSQHGLDGLTVSPSRVNPELIRAISNREKAQAKRRPEIDDALVRIRKLLLGYRAALSEKNSALGVTAIETLRKVAELDRRTSGAESRNARVSTRFDLLSLQSIAENRKSATDKLVRAASLGEFRFGPEDSPWYGVDFADPDEARSAFSLAERLSLQHVPQLHKQALDMLEQTPLRSFDSINQLSQYMGLLRGIRDSLELFRASIYEHPLEELIAAYDPDRNDRSLGWNARRQLRKLVQQDYVRPGAHVPDMYAALVRVKQQQELWQELTGTTALLPEIPTGLANVHVLFQRVSADLIELDVTLGRSGADSLSELANEDLIRTMAGLAASSAVFDNLLERATLREDLRRYGLDDFLVEMSRRHIDEKQVPLALEYAWWHSAFDYLLSHDSRLLRGRTDMVTRLERDFAIIDGEHQGSSGPLLATQLAQRWRVAVADEVNEAAALKSLLKSGINNAAALLHAAPRLMKTLVPVWLASPYEVPLIPASTVFDVVIVPDAASLSLAELAPALARAKQVVLLGDPVSQRPESFTVSASPRSVRPANRGVFEPSVFNICQPLFTEVELTRSYRAGGADLMSLVNESFYGNRIKALPWAGSFLGRGSIEVDYVENAVGVPNPDTGTPESPEAEVARVVTLVREHAINRSDDSLMVVTPSKHHAERIRAAVEAAFVSRDDVADFLSKNVTEPFRVLTLGEATVESRDRVIFSLGYGVTRHNRVLADFGDLSSPDGERLLTIGMTRARRGMTLVSSLKPEAFESGRLLYGAKRFMDILETAGTPAPVALESLASDPLRDVLITELAKYGIEVVGSYPEQIPIVARYNDLAVAIEFDVDTHDLPLRDALRLRPEQLRRLGWHYFRVQSLAVLLDPAKLAASIAKKLGASKGGADAASATTELPITEAIEVIS